MYVILQEIERLELIQTVRNEALEDAAKTLENGSFLHEQAPSKLLATQAANAIRALKMEAV